MLKIQFRTNIVLIRANKIFCPIKRVSLLNLLIEVVDGLVHSLDLGRKQSLKWKGIRTHNLLIMRDVIDHWAVANLINILHS